MKAEQSKRKRSEEAIGYSTRIHTDEKDSHRLKAEQEEAKLKTKVTESKRFPKPVMFQRYVIAVLGYDCAIAVLDTAIFYPEQ